jgi:hypothetical protein
MPHARSKSPAAFQRDVEKKQKAAEIAEAKNQAAKKKLEEAEEAAKNASAVPVRRTKTKTEEKIEEYDSYVLDYKETVNTWTKADRLFVVVMTVFLLGMMYSIFNESQKSFLVVSCVCYVSNFLVFAIEVPKKRDNWKTVMATCIVGCSFGFYGMNTVKFYKDETGMYEMLRSTDAAHVLETCHYGILAAKVDAGDKAKSVEQLHARVNGMKKASAGYFY